MQICTSVECFSRETKAGYRILAQRQKMILEIKLPNKKGVSLHPDKPSTTLIRLIKDFVSSLISFVE